MNTINNLTNMCDFNNGIKFCVCDSDKIRYRKQDLFTKKKGKLVKIPNKKNDSIPIIFIWYLYKYIKKDEDNFELGRYLFPSDNIGNGLNAEWIALNLNIEDCFDFDYTPSEGDNLFVTQNIELAPYLSFIYKNGQWIIEHYDPFATVKKQLFHGEVKEINNNKSR